MKNSRNIIVSEKKVSKGLSWVHFGEKRFECHAVSEKMIDFFKETKKLPHPCDMCFKSLIFWKKWYSEKVVKRFFELLETIQFPISGKYNSGVVVFYFREKDEMLKFNDLLKEKLDEFDIKGFVQWRRACKSYQKAIPEYWKNAKELVSDQK